MPLYKPNSNPAALAQSAMSNATQAAASQTRQTTVNVKKESNFWDDLYKGAAALNMGARAVGGMVDAVEDVKGMYDEYKVRDAYDAMSKAYAEGGIDALQTNPDFQDYHHAQAFGRIMKDRAASEKGRMEMLPNAKKIAEQNYNDVRAALMPGLEAYKSGDMNTFSHSMVNASQVANMPYRIEPAGDGNYKLFFRSDAKGGWTDTGRKMTGQEVFEMGQNYLRGEIKVLSGMGMKLTPYNQQQVLEGMRRAMATNDTNVENMADYSKHIPLLNANGRIVGMAIPQNPLDGSKNTEYDAYGMNGKPLGRFDVQGILQRGMRFGNMVQKAGRGASGAGAGNGVNSKAYALIKDLATVVDPATGEKNIDVEMAAALERGIASGYTPYQYAQKLTRDMDAYASTIARNNPQLTPEEVHQYARRQAFATSRSSGSTDPLGLRGGSKQTPPAARPSTTDARIRDALTDGRQDYEAGRGATAPALPSDINPLGNISGPTLSDMLGQNNSWSAQTRGNMARQQQSQEIEQAFGSAMEDFAPGNYGHGSFAPQNKGTLAAHYDRRREQDRADNAVKRMRSLHPGY